MSRSCSHCGHNGHNSRTCFDKGFKLFGVRLTESSSCSSSSPSAMMRKSVSMGNLSHYGSSSEAEAASSSSASPLEQLDLGDTLDGYASDDLVHTNSSVRERKKGVPWTEEEHRLFLLGLQKLGKGDWRGISRNFVKTRTPTQVASHAQKYFLRRSNLNKRRRRSSLFDMTPDAVSGLSEESLVEEPAFERADACPGVHELRLRHSISGNREALVFSRHAYPVGGFSVSSTSLPLSCTPMDVSEVIEEAIDAEEIKDLDGCEMREVAEETALKPSAGLSMMESVPEGNGESGAESDHFRFPYPLFAMWPGSGLHSSEKQESCSTEPKIVKPIPMIPTPPVRINNSIEESQLSGGSMRPVMDPTPLSYKLLKEGSRDSAFHTMNSVSSSKLEDTQGSLSNAISVS